MRSLPATKLFALALVLTITGTALAGPMIVRVMARDYQQLYDHIPFKGSSIEIAGADLGTSYDLVLDREDLGLVRSSGLDWRIVTDDLDTERDELAGFGYYCDYDSIVRILRNWAANYPTLCMFDSIGQTYLGRWIYAVKISDNVTVQEDEPEVLLEAMHHSREWATPQAVRHFGDTLLTSYGTSPEITAFVDNHQAWLIPVVNVDGYDYDYPGQRSWRRNRKPFGGGTGCDPNRDYGGGCDTIRANAWGAIPPGAQATHQPGNNLFLGPYAFWADCVDALQSFYREHTFVADASLHSYSELVIWPFGTGVVPYDQMIADLGTGMAAQMSRLGGGYYTPQQANRLYPTTGGSKDWMYGWGHNVGGYPCMSYTIELGTTFYQPVGNLESIQTECFDGVFYLFTRADSIIDQLEGEVPPPVLVPVDSSASGNFTLTWSPTKPEHNHPDRWEVEEFSGLTITADDFESGTDKWTLTGFSSSTAQAHSGSRSLFSGMTNNQSNGMTTKHPYPVQAGDSVTFWLWYDLETEYDVFITEVSENGLEWTQLHPRYEGNSGGWQREAFSLEPWAGRSVYIRMRVMSDDNTLRLGAYVDDVHPVPLFSNAAVLDSAVTDTTFDVTGKQVGTYWYRVRGHNAAWDWNSHGPLEDMVVTGTGIAEGPTPQKLKTALNVGRNPSTGPFELSYTLGRPGNASLVVLDASGRTVRTLASGMSEAGVYSARWDGRDAAGRKLAAGVYFCRLDADETVTVRTVLLD